MRLSVWTLKVNKRQSKIADDCLEAPTAQEIADQLPHSRGGHYLTITPWGGTWFAGYYNVSADCINDEQVAYTMVEALAKLWLKVNEAQS